MRLTDDPCDAVTGAARELCQKNGSTGGGGGTGAGQDPTTLPDSLDPLTNFAHSCANAAAWVARKAGEFIGDPSAVDFTSTGFLQQYAIVFAASTFLVLLLWLLAVAKRAVRGVPLNTAIGEAIGLLWLAVAVTAFMPLILYTVVQATAAVTRGLAAGIGVNAGTVFDQLATGLTDGHMGGGPLILIVASLLVIVLCGVLILLLVLRALGLYLGALLGIPVFSGLVDKDLWLHLRRWSGLMASLIAIEPVIVIVVGLAAAVQAHGQVVTGIAITAIACAVSAMLITKFPGWGDGVRVARMVGRAGGGAVNAVVGTSGAAHGVSQGIQAHGGRGSKGPRSERGSSSPRASKDVAGGISAHGQRPNRGTPKKKGHG